MGVRLAAGPRENVEAALDVVIPKDSLIVTRDNMDSGLMFYDSGGNLISISEKTRFETFTEAQTYLKTYGYPGLYISVQNGTTWVPYLVQGDFSLMPIGSGGSPDFGGVFQLDGGNAAGHDE